MKQLPNNLLEKDTRKNRALLSKTLQISTPYLQKICPSKIADTNGSAIQSGV
jgi:hypothetical protein